MNVWSFTGNVGKSEMRYLQNGDGVLSFSVAVRSGYGKNESTTWANCSLFGKRAESLVQYIQKGAQVGVTGEVDMREWVDKEGGKRQNLEVRVNDVSLLGGKSGSSATSVPQPQSNNQSSGFDDFDSDIPF